MLAFLLVQIVPAQIARREQQSKGPRALGLLQLQSNGKVRLIPITIMFDGRFYDAGAYKASPVPMALEPQTVYEAVRTGVSQGLFTITDARQIKNAWIADGTWQPADKEAPKKIEVPVQAPQQEETDKPPVLRRPTADKPQSQQTPPSISPPPSTSAQQPVPSTQSASTTVAAPSSTAASSATAEPPAPADSERPVLRRGPQSGAGKGNAGTDSASAKATSPSKPSQRLTKVTTVQTIPAISDAGGPQSRPFLYDLKPDEETQLRKKMLALAASDVLARVKQATVEATEQTHKTRSSRTKPGATKVTQPVFEDVQLRVLDLSSANEPVLVLSAKATMPPSGRTMSGGIKPGMEYFVTLVARNDIYNELHKAMSNVTDSQHLDVTPKLDLIDAVDADGDGRGELLFRQTSEAGTSYVIYRVVGDQLYPLYQSAKDLEQRD